MTTIARLAAALSLALVACAEEEADPCALPERLAQRDVLCGTNPDTMVAECAYFDEDGNLRVWRQQDQCEWAEAEVLAGLVPRREE